MKILKTNPGCNLFLGHQGEKLALQIVFDIGPWINTYGAGTAHLLHQRKGDTEPYPVATVQEGTEVRWDVTDADTAVEGNGRYELHFYTGESLVKSVTGDTLVRGSLRYGVDPPEAVQLWLDHVAEEEHKIYQAVVDSEAAKAAAETAADTSVAAAGNAATSEKAAAASQKAAGESAGKAAASEQEAAKSAKNAGQSANEASDSAAAAKKSAEDLAAAESNADKSAQNAESAKNEAVAAAQSAGMSETNANKSQDAAAESEKNAKTAETNAKTAESNAKASEQAAAASAAEAKQAATSVMGVADWNAAEGEPGYVLNRTHWVEGGMVEILPETNGALGRDEPLGLVSGKTYVVNWNGTEYECVAVTTKMEGTAVVVLGDYSSVVASCPATGEPFGIMELPADVASGTYWAWVANDGSTSATLAFSISEKSETVHKLPGKFLPDGVPYVEGGGMEEILPETELVGEGSEVITPLSAPIGLKAEETYVVNFNGTEYTCVAQDIGSVVGMECYLLGNGGILGLPPTDEPFIILDVPNGADGMYAQITTNGSGTISIYQKSEIIHKLPGKFLPDGVPYVEEDEVPFNFTFDGDTTGKEIIDLGDGAYCVKMTDVVLTMDDLVGATVVVESGEEMTIELTADVIVDVNGDGSILGAEVLLAIQRDTTMEGIALTSGLYFVEFPEAYTKSLVKEGATVKAAIIQKIDPRCLPDDVGGVKLFDVPFTVDAAVASTTMTFAEIYEKVTTANTIVRGVATTPEGSCTVCSLQSYTESSVAFSCVLATGSNGLQIFSIAVNSDDTCTFAVVIK